MKKVFFITLTSAFIFCLSSCDTSERDFKKATEIGTAQAYDMFITNHLKSKLVEDARDSIVAMFEREDDLHSMAKGICEVVDYEAASRVRDCIVQRAKSLYDYALEDNSIDGWNAFIEAVPNDYQKDAQERLIDLQWQNESIAWQLTTEKDIAVYYEKYLEQHPHGKHAKQAERRLIDLEVDAVFAGEHGELPAMDKGYSTGSSRSSIEIENRTQYELTVSYSGPDSKRLFIPAYGTRKMNIGNGFYRVAASVGHGVIPFAGTEQLDGSYFSSSFYIETSRF